MTPPSAPARAPARRRAFRLPRTVKRRPRLYIGAAIMVVVYVALAGAGLREATHALVAWNAGAWTFIALILAMMAYDPRDSICDHAALEDENPWMLLLIAIFAASAAIAAIIWELGPVKNMGGFLKAIHIVLVAATLLSAWTFIHLMFALHYAGEYYAAAGPGKTRGGLTFPGGSEPEWSDFLYQAMVIGCACATADVNTTSPSMRVACLAQGVVAFLFNTIILALTINIGSGYI
jgi:uncharacterized membrane protein